MKNSILLIFLSLLFVSCNYKDKENALNLREKQLLDKEKSFAQKEADYQSLLKMRDSIFSKKDADSIKIVRWPQEIAGSWIGKVICTESNCSDYVVGDQRTDTWEFASDSLQLFSKIINNNNLVRLYSGKFENNEIKLNFKTDSTAKKKVDMNVLLNDISDTKIKGIRTIAVDNCMAKFSVELVRSTK
ncbi:hypothetical protein AB670_03081 [Chryseobacterium sp. MOF25P]|uniref:hypothetical protein n=1 Tax=unclassified Chryseobacterium TaxID=2593645 RepID=UPI0008055302|nr:MULTISPECIES: hypothetical protein [unclassified Chryseobacterium]OBW40616.1 hypothetical protein AB670_03081 [Chryseobacterium sp. MOF25P]OBW44749.1 hypothetical protein AB671_03191 [Chryseobacterium sp. BGARF1]